MANKGLFASALAKFLPAADALNREDAPAYAYGPEHKLAQLAATGTLQDTFYAAAETQLGDVLDAARALRARLHRQDGGLCPRARRDEGHAGACSRPT